MGMFLKAVVCLALVLCLGLAASCKNANDSPASGGKPLVICTTLPLYSLASQIAGDTATVELLPDPRIGPHGYQLSLKDRARLEKASVIVMHGMGMEEPALAKFAAERGKKGVTVVFAADAMPETQRRELGECTCCVHEREEGEAVEAWDPHIWLGKDGAAVMANSIQAALVKAMPAKAEAIAANGDQTRTEIAAAFGEAQDKLAPYKGRKMLTHHDAWGYFARDYGFTIEASLTVAGESASLKNVENVRKAIRRGARIMFSEPQFDPGPLKALAAEEGAQVIMLDPCEQTDKPLTPSIYLDTVRANAAKLAAALGATQ